jgi:hypothetical protein
MRNHIPKFYDTALKLRTAGRLFGERALRGRPRVPAQGYIETGEKVAATGEVMSVEAVESQSVTVEDFREYVPNNDVWKDRLPRRWRTKWERRIKRWREIMAALRALRDKSMPRQAKRLMLRYRRPLTNMELAEIREDEERKRLETFHKERAMRGANMIRNTLTRLGHCHRVTKDGKERLRGQVRFDSIEYSPLVYRYHVDGARLPYGVSITNLYTDEVCTNLSASLEHPVRAEIKQVNNFVTGLWYTIEIAATLGIPNRCSFADLLPLIPNSAPALSFLVGYSENKRVNWRSLEEMPHFLGGGQTNGGKSNFMHVMICTFVARNTPADVSLLMIDMKFDGIELDRYAGIPHLIKVLKDADGNPSSGIACNPAEAIEILRWVLIEGDRRGKMFKKEKIQNLKLWNRKHKTRRLSSIVVFMDELALLRLDKEHGAEAYELIQKISSVARAAGIHLVGFTQSSNKRVVDEMVKVNFPGRICFSVPDASSSILFVNDGSAINLMPAGRARFKYGTDNMLVQTPLIEPANVTEIINNARAGKVTSQLMKNTVSAEEIIAWSLEENNSSLAFQDAYNKFGPRIEQAALKSLLQEMESQIYTVGEHDYQILPGAGRKPRIVAKITHSVETGVPDPQHDTQHANMDQEEE